MVEESALFISYIQKDGTSTSVNPPTHILLAQVQTPVLGLHLILHLTKRIRYTS